MIELIKRTSVQNVFSNIMSMTAIHTGRKCQAQAPSSQQAMRLSKSRELQTSQKDKALHEDLLISFIC